MASSISSHALMSGGGEPAAGGPGAMAIPVSGVGREALDAFLASERAPPGGLTLSGLDGLLTGVAVGPELIAPSEWLPLAWGGESPVFDDQAEAQAVLGGMMSRFNEIIAQTRDRTFQPILREGPDGRLLADQWAKGFGGAVSLRFDSWRPLLNSREGVILLFPILALGGGKEALAGLDVDELEPESLLETAALLPGCITAIAAYWLEHRAERPGGVITDRVSNAVRLGPKVGRNEPCPCGSGRKFKKCCGV